MIRRGVGRVGRPGLVGTVARTAVIAGTATAVSGGMQRHQAAKAANQAEAQEYEAMQQQAAMQQAAAQAVAAQQAAAPPQAAPAAGGDVMAQLQQLATMQQQGLLTPEEFSAAKAKLLGS